MNPPASTTNNRSWLIQWGVGIVLTAAAVFVLSRVVSWEELTTAFQAIPPITLVWVSAVYLISMGFRVVAWQTLLERKVSLWHTFLALNEGYFLNNILPLRLGEIGRAFLLGRRSGLGTLRVLSTIVVERVYDLVIASSLLLAMLPLVVKLDWVRPLATVLLVALLGGLVGLYFAARNRETVERWLTRLGGRWKPVQRWVLPSLHNILDGFAALTRFDLFVLSFLALGFSWFLAMVRDYILVGTLFSGAPFWWVVLAISAASLGGALPSMAASLGLFEGAATGALTLAGAPAEVGLTYALVIHAVHLVFSSLIGGLALTREGKSLTGIITDLRNLK